jgi:hypothetical protein
MELRDWFTCIWTALMASKPGGPGAHLPWDNFLIMVGIIFTAH